MYDESYGLRFDIYERVHLSDELVGIDQLEEVELTPHIQVLPAGEQVTVRGSLLLSGAYIGTSEDRRSQSLEHWIPVEITLPLNRIRSLDEIRVDIENFDVDLLSTRSLNITGVLSLRGIQVERSGSTTWEPEQFTVVHEADDFSTEPDWLRDYGEGTHELGNRSEGHERSQADQIQQTTDASLPSAARIESQQQTMPMDKVNDDTQVFVQAAGAEEAERLEQDQVLTAPVATEPPKINLLSKSDTSTPGLASNSEAAVERLSDQLLRPPVVDASDSSTIDAEAATESARVENPSVSSTHATPAASSTSTTWTWADSPWGTPAAQVSKEESREEKAVEEAGLIADDQELDDRTESAGSNVRELEAEAVHQEAEVPIDQAEPILDKNPMKVAIGSSKVNEAESGTIGLSTLIRTNHQLKEKEEQSVIEETEPSAPSRDTVSNDAHWQSIFLHRVQEERSFSRVRMCIVQRDDTLDLIASRYQMNSRDIAAHNHLSEPSVAEGQVLYIPLIVNA